MYYTAIALAFSLFSSAVFGQSYSVILSSLKPIALPPPGYISLYFIVQKIDENGSGLQIYVPRHPNKWTLKIGEEMKNQLIWRGSLGNNQSQELLIELFDHDSIGKQADNLVGSFKITLDDSANKLVAKWSRPNICTPSISIGGKEQTIRTETCSGPSRYQLAFKLITAASR
ncbi:MAG: hypothetical protein COB66_03485 [Coxiella sp. (in: Bacteria)]|nr:MAG: hypothetical protein COB66_03485 [Coxiella sp. (in: g-proteobacteria)]